MKPSAALVDTLYAEMLARIKEDDQTVPYRRGDYFYYSRTEQGKQYPILCRKLGSVDAPEEVTLDLNALAAGHPFFALGMAVVSDDGHLLAYTTDLTGFRQYTLSRQGSAHRRAPARSHREGRVDRVGRRRPDAVLRHGGRGQAPVPALPPRARRSRGRSRLRGDGRAVQPGRRAHAEPPLSARHLRELHDHRGALSRRRRDRCAVDAHPAPGAGSRVPRRALDGRGRGRALLHPHQWRRPAELSPRHRARGGSAPGELDRAHRAPRRRDARGRRGLRHAPRGSRAGRWAEPPPGDDTRRRRRASHRVPGARVRGVARPQPGVRGILVPVSLPVARHAALGVRLRRGGRAARSCSSRWRCSAATIRRATASSACTRRPPTAPASPSPSSAAPTRRATARARSCSRATAPTASRCP